MSEVTGGTIAEVQEQFSLLKGATLRLWGLVSTHGTVILRVTDIEHETGYVGFSRGEYLNLPAEMRHVQLRLAIQEETNSLHARLPPQRARYLQNNDHLIIMHDEGKAEVWARGIGLKYKILSSPQSFINWVSGPIWPGGPALEEL